MGKTKRKPLLMDAPEPVIAAPADTVPEFIPEAPAIVAGARYEVPDAVLVHLLIQAGFLPRKGRINKPKIDAAVMEYQKFHEFDSEGWRVLEPDGWAGPQTERHLKQTRFCNHPDKMALESRGRWSPNIATNLKWGVAESPKSVPLATFKAAIQAAFDSWSRVCNVKASYTTSRGEANLIIGASRIDGPGGTLAWSYLPTGMEHTKQLEQRYDDDEGFGTDIILQHVIAHELGHFLGIVHLQSGNLLAPFYSAKIGVPQAGDIAEAVGLYGRAIDPPTPTDPGGAVKTITLRGVGLEVV